MMNDQILHSLLDCVRGKLEPSSYAPVLLPLTFLRWIGQVKTDLVIPPGATFEVLYRQRLDKDFCNRIVLALESLDSPTASFSASADVFKFLPKAGQSVLAELFDLLSKEELLPEPKQASAVFEQLCRLLAPNARLHVVPDELSDLLVAMLNPEFRDSICDPLCQAGVLLTACQRWLNHQKPSRSSGLYGHEPNQWLRAIANMNLALHGETRFMVGVDALQAPFICNKSSDAAGSWELSTPYQYPWITGEIAPLEQFDLQLSSLLFTSEWTNQDAKQDPFDRYKRGVPARNRPEYAYLQHMIACMKPETGRIGAVVSHGVLFRGASEARIRQQLIEENLLDAVIGLPEKLFQGAGMASVILIFKEQKSDRSVLFIDASKEFRQGRVVNHLTASSAERIKKAYQGRLTTEHYSRLVSFDEIKKNNFNLTIQRYINDQEKASALHLQSIAEDRSRILKQLAELNQEAGISMEKLQRDLTGNKAAR